MIKKVRKLILFISITLSEIMFIISLSISVPILYRPFYYSHIKTLNLEEKTGYSYEEIKEAYDDVIDYTTSFNKEFKTGKLKYSNEGMNHFKDCKILFMINFLTLGITSIIIIIKRMFFKNIKILKHSISFYSGLTLILGIVSISVIYLILGFERSFNLFHKILFFGKDNWIFDTETDEIINILPNEFFMNCAILIVLITMTISIILIIKDILNNEKIKKL